MDNQTEIIIKRLDARIQAAVVDLVDADNSIYEVFIPGAIREVTTVIADSAEDAVAKTREALIVKIKHNATKKIPSGKSDGKLQVENVRQNARAEEGVING